MNLFKLALLSTVFILSACKVGMPNNISVGIGGGNHNFGLGTTINFPVNTKPIPTEPPVIAGTEKQPQKQSQQKNKK